MQWDKVPVIDEPWAAFYPKETPRRLDYDVQSIDVLLRKNAASLPGNKAWYFEGATTTFKDLDLAVGKFAAGLHRLGIGKGDVVLIDMPNIPQFIIAFFAIIRLGAIANPIIPLNKYSEIVHQANDSNAKALVILDFLYAEYLDGKDLSRMAKLEFIVMTGTGEYLPPIKRVLGTALGKIPRMKRWPATVGRVPVHAFQDVLSSGDPASLVPVDIDPVTAPACLIYTGGTTGTPKGVVLTHFNLLSNCKQAYTWATTQIPGVEESIGNAGMVCVLPMSHSFGLSIGLLIGYYSGFHMILFPRPPEKISDLLKVAAAQDAIFCPGVPTLWNRINQDPDSPKHAAKLTKFKACLSGAAPLPLEVKETFEKMTGALITEGYGMSEASPLLTATPFTRPKVNSVGVPMPDTWIKIVDLDAGETVLPPCPATDCAACGPDQAKHVGEICGTGPQVMQGYLNKPAETASVLRKDKQGITWYHTSDIGCLDAEGYLHIKDRKRDMLKYKGHAVFPREVEDLMYQYEPIFEVGVYGRPSPDPEIGETIVASVALKPEYKGKVTAEDIKAWCMENLSSFKYPREIHVVDELPKSLVGKVLRRVLREGDAAGQAPGGPEPPA